MKTALTLLAGLVLLSACVQLPDILKAGTVGTASFTGSHDDLAACIKQRIHGGKVQYSLDGSRIDIYDAKKSWSNIGVSHYAVSVFQDGQVELRKLPELPLSDEARKRLWVPVEACVNQTSAT